LPVVVFVYETWSVTLRHEHRLKVFHNSFLKKIFRSEFEDLSGDCKMLHNGKLHGLYFTINITRATSSRLTRNAGHVERMGERTGAYRV